MCGIAGIVSEAGVAPGSLSRMLSVLRHRGPDDEGYALVSNNSEIRLYRGDETHPEYSNLQHINSVNEKGPVLAGLAHRRLSILDLSAAGHQPMVDNASGYVISYNGEVYNYKEIRLELEAKGFQFRSGSDTEVVLNAYIKWGESCVEKFVGMWAIAIWDLARSRLFLSRDRFGIKPLYYVNNNGFFAFASEIKGLLELEQVNNQVLGKHAIQYISYGRLNDPNQSLFTMVRSVKPGTNIVFDYITGSVDERSYYDLRAAVNNITVASTEAQAINEYRDIFSSSIDLHMRSDVPVGSCLSGGLDSSLIVAFAAEKFEGDKFHTFTAAYDDKQIDESDYAGLVSNHFPVVKAHYTYPESAMFWQDLDQLIWHQDLPIGSTSMFAQWCVMKKAADEGLKVLLDGQGADETLGGYSIFAGIFLLELLKSGRLIEFSRNAVWLKQHRSVNIPNEFGRALFGVLPDRLKRLISGRARISGNFISPDCAADVQAVKVPGRGGSSVREGNFRAIKYGLSDLLRYEDRNSMAFSIESRVPFLDHRLLEYGISLSSNVKIHEGWLKYVIRKVGEDKLPPEVIWRRDKKGFVTPQMSWKDDLRNVLLEYVQDSRVPQILDRKVILQYISKDISNVTHLTEFWRMILFLKWADIYKVSI